MCDPPSGKVRKVVSISTRFRQDGLVKEGLDAFPKLTPEAFKGSPIEIEYKKLSPTPDKFADLVKSHQSDGFQTVRLSSPALEVAE